MIKTDRRTYGERGLVEEEEEIYEVENFKCEAMINKNRGLGVRAIEGRWRP